MFQRKLIVVLFMLLIISFQLPFEAMAQCSSRQQNNICNTCKTQTLNSSECMATCPTQTCPTCPSNSNTTCLQCLQETVEKISANLKGNYNLTVDLFSRGTHDYKLSIKSTRLNPNTGLMQFDYSANHLDSGITYTSIGFITPGFIHFTLPVKIINSSVVPSIFVGGFYPLSCSVLVESDNSIKSGSCGSTDTNTIPSSGESFDIFGSISSFGR